ncbi:acetyltransferase [Paenibacillus aurantius]|uniref:Acetyltransferase n=1 Tax=Paenibacillus aurantius TaxID=2918900 RepID=A0AA96LIP4_9BACL|nr:acetyltransferase [Paenibacillus aurantius]WNQ12706.1 acetyltransferase [Paenibacillus aurantius]
MKIAVIGDGGHSKVIQDMIRASRHYRLCAVLDDRYDRLVLDQGRYTGPLASMEQLSELAGPFQVVIAIGNNAVRKTIVAKLGLPPESYVSLVHQTAVVSPSATLGRGTVVMANTIINADARIGSHAIINSGAIVEHDCRVQDYCHIAPRATLTGAVNVKEGSLIGAGATVIPGMSVGEWTLVGAGATVVCDLPGASTAVGTPARIVGVPAPTLAVQPFAVS